jgi:hypothetical protein
MPLAAAFSADTASEVMQLQIMAWRSMSPADKLEAVDAANRACEALSAAGVRCRHLTATEAEVRRRVIALRIGRDLSIAAYDWDPDREGW